MSGPQPEERVRVPLLRQRWRHVLFLHWRCPVDAVRRLLPDDLEPDLHGGSAWVSLTPFLAEGTRPSVSPAIPRLSRFPETNLRTYVTGPGGVDGLWFFTLEVDSVATAVGGRLAVPYRLADMDVETAGDTTTYRSERRSDRSVGHHIRARRRGPLDERSDLDDWLTGRWRAWTRRAGRLATVAVQHEPWPLHGAELLEFEESLLASHGVTAPREPHLVHASPGVDARLGFPRPT